MTETNGRADEVFAVVAGVISDVCGIDCGRLRPAQRIEDLEIDSLLAGEILAQTERRLDIDLDFRTISDDWSELTLGDLVAQLGGTNGAAR